MKPVLDYATKVAAKMFLRSPRKVRIKNKKWAINAIREAVILGELSALDRVFTLLKQQPEQFQTNEDLRALLHLSIMDYKNLIKEEFKEEIMNIEESDLIARYEQQEEIMNEE
jgi:hypothetical protein